MHPTAATPLDDRSVHTHAGSTVAVRPTSVAALGLAARVARATLAAEPAPASPTTLRTNRLLLRPLREADRPEFLRVLARSRASLDHHCPLGASATCTDADVFDRQLALSDGALRTGRALRLIALDHSGALVGGFNINDIARGLEHSGELVFWLAAASRGRGYATEALRALLDHALADIPRGLGLHRVSGYVAPDNAPCLRVIRALGLRPCLTHPALELRIGDRRIRHEPFEVFPAVPPVPSTSNAAHVVEAKPSIAEDLFGRGLLSILRTEGAATPFAHSDDRALS